MAVSISRILIGFSQFLTRASVYRLPATTLFFPTCLPFPPIFPITAITHTCFSSIRLPASPPSFLARKKVHTTIPWPRSFIPISPDRIPSSVIIIAFVHLRVGWCVQILDVTDDKLAPSFISPPLRTFRQRSGSTRRRQVVTPLSSPLYTACIRLEGCAQGLLSCIHSSIGCLPEWAPSPTCDGPPIHRTGRFDFRIPTSCSRDVVSSVMV